MEGARMTSSDIAGLIIMSLLGLLIIVIAVFWLLGRGAFLLAGYNTMSKEEKEKYDEKSLCKFMGKIILPIGVLTPSIAIGGIYGIDWIGGAYIAFVIVIIVFALVYCNTGNRFRK